MLVSKWRLMVLLLLGLSLALYSCGGSGSGTGIAGDGSGTIGATSTTVSGKVALSSVSSSSGSGKPGPSLAKSNAAYKAARQMRKSGIDEQIINSSIRQMLGSGFSKAAGIERMALQAGFDDEFILSGAVVQLFDAEHPEFIYPIAEALSDENGSFILNKLRYADSNNPLALVNSSQYVNGDPIPVGRYSLIASKFDANIGKLFVAVQSIVKNYAGAIEGNNLVAQDSDAVADVLTMFARSKHPIRGDFGFYEDKNNNTLLTVVPKDADLQITFSQAMARLSVLEASGVWLFNGATKDIIDYDPSTPEVDPVKGQWKVAANLLSASFDPETDLTVDQRYKVTINGGKQTATKDTAKNVFGRSIPEDVVGFFKAGAADPANPLGTKLRPSQSPSFDDTKLENGQYRTRVTAPIRIETDKPLDINYFDITVTPSIGEIPTVLYLGSYINPNDELHRYVYDIIPSEPIKLNTTYAFTVDGASDLARNPIIPFTFSFVTEAQTSGVVNTAPPLVQEAQAQAKDVFGKWLRGFSDKNVTMLTNYMTGDFVWAADGDSEGGSEDDLNRDGRLSSYEFTKMLEKWFQMLRACDSKVSGDVTSDIIVNSTDFLGGHIPLIDEVTDYNRARMTFELIVSSDNYSNPQCQEAGAPEALYLELKRINGAWYVSKGADFAPAGGQALVIKPVKDIELITPREREELTLPYSGEVRPAFKWTGIGNVTTYAVVVIDARSDWNESGWVALINGAGTQNIDMKVNFNPKTGDAGNVHVLDVRDAGWFREQMKAVKPGGEYIWSVIAFETLTKDRIKYGIFSPARNLATDLIGTSRAREFTVEGHWLDLGVKVKNILGKEYPFDQFLGGYDLTNKVDGLNLDVARLEIFTPSGSDSGTLWQYGFGQRDYPLTFTGGNASIDVPLYYGRNDFYICDGPTSGGYDGMEIVCEGVLEKEFTVITSAGEKPVFEVISVIDNTTLTDLEAPDVWGNIYNGTVQYVNVTARLNGTHDNSNGLYTYLNTYSDAGSEWKNFYNASGWTPNTDREISFSNIPVYAGWNTIEITVDFCDASYNNCYWYNARANIEVGPGGGVPIDPATKQIVITGFSGAQLVTDSYVYQEEWMRIVAGLYDMGSSSTVSGISLDMSGVNPVDCYVELVDGVSRNVCGRLIASHFVDTGETQDWVNLPIFENNRGFLFDDGTWAIAFRNSSSEYESVASGLISDVGGFDVFKGMSVLVLMPLSAYSQDDITYAFIFSETTNVYVPPFSVNVAVLKPSTGTLKQDYSYSGYVSYSSADVDSIRVTGVASDIANGVDTIVNGISYDHYTSGSSLGGWIDVNPDGSFQGDIDLINQYNDIYLRTCSPPYDDLTICNGPHSYYDVHVNTEAGGKPPKYVSIDSPAHNSDMPFDITGATVYGHLDIANFVGAPWNWSVNVYDYDGTGYQFFTNGTTFTYDKTTSYFYFQPDFLANHMYRIYVRVMDSGTSLSHAHYVYINNNRNYGEYSYKPEGSQEYTRQMVLDAVYGGRDRQPSSGLFR